MFQLKNVKVARLVFGELSCSCRLKDQNLNQDRNVWNQAENTKDYKRRQRSLYDAVVKKLW